MNKLVRYGLLLLVVSLIGLSIFFIGAPAVLAYEGAVTSQDYSPKDRADAIAAANNAISKLPIPSQIVAYEQAYIDDVANAFALVAIAREKYEAEDSDFKDLAKLYTAERHVLKLFAIQNARNAIDLIPPLDQITEADREAIEEARRLVDYAMQEYGATRFQICWRYDYLQDAEDKLPEEVEPEPEPEPKPKPKPDDRVPTPPTGGISGLVAIGAVLSGAGFYFINRRRSNKGKH
jgi:hypothetical protein